MKDKKSRTPWLVWIFANALILGIVLYAGYIESVDSDRYYRMVQEDETLEWATFWAFLVAAVLFGKQALEQRRQGVKFPWFYAGLAFFCFLVGMEEISWGQRVFGFRPPNYFLANNFQQELNVHNVISTDLRKFVLKAIILGYGVMLAVFAQVQEIRSQLRRLGISIPPIQLAPAFLGIYFLYEEYPWGHTGEWVEYVLGLGFLFVALLSAPVAHAAKKQKTGKKQATGKKQVVEENASPLRRQLVSVALFWCVVLGLGMGTAAWSRQASSARPELLEMAQVELAALKEDFRSGKGETRCDRHKRLYTYIEKYDQDEMFDGDFTKLTERGLPEDRARYFLDPWNSPYWIRDRCTDDSRKAFIYSFGPNRRRESSTKEILGDDLGIVLLELGS